MTADRDLLAALQRALTDADVDTSELLERAWSDAQGDVEATLRRLFTQDLLRRCLETLEDARRPAAGPGPSVVGSGPDAVEPAPAAPGEPTPGTSAGPAASRATTSSAGTDAVAPAEPASRSEAAPSMDRSLPPEPSGTPAATGRAAAGKATSTYVFGIVAPDASLPDRGDLPALPGGGPLRFLEATGCKALVCDVEPAVFEVLDDPGEEGLDVLAAAAQAHDATLVAYVGTPVIPLRMGTAFPDDATTVMVLERNAEVFVGELGRLAGHAEWAVTVLGDPATTDEDDTARAETGTAYLQQRRAALTQRDRRWEREEQLAEAIHAPLAAVATAASRVESRPLESGDPPLLHAVYLVADAAFEPFAATLERLRAERAEVVIELTGPWPPYHFTAFELDVGTDA